MKRCTSCGGSEGFEATTVVHPVEVAGHRFETFVPAQRCKACGEELTASDALERAELVVGRYLAEAGQVSGEAFRFLRKALGLRAADLASLLGVAAETVSRWENGARDVDRGAWVALASMVEDRLEDRDSTTRFLRALDAQSKLAKTTRLEVPAKRTGT